MKKIVYLLMFTLLSSACCKVDVAIGVSIEYTSLTEPTNAWVLRTSKEDIGEIQDTIIRINLSEINNHRYFLDLANNDTNVYILQTEGLVHSDTLADFNAEVKGKNCNVRIESVTYLINGTYKDVSQLIIP